MHTLEVRLLGGVHLLLDNRPVGPFPTHWAAGVLAYLALDRGRPIHRDIIAARFWPDDDDRHARASLRRALWGARTLIEPSGVPRGTFLRTDRPYVTLADGPSTAVDVARFDELLGWCADGAHDDVASLEAALRLYRGDFMDGFDYEWCGPERERLRLALLCAHERLMELHMRGGDWRLAIVHGQEILRQDALRESIHRDLMICHFARGDRPLAIRQYRACEKILEEELGIAPMAATQRLLREIQAGTLTAPPDPPRRPPGERGPRVRTRGRPLRTGASVY